MNRVSFAVQAHPGRALLAGALAEQIVGTVSWDPDPEGIPSPWRGFRHLMATSPADATHRVQLQDDAVVCQHFREAAEAAIAARPDRLIVFFVGGNPHFHAQAVLDACRRDVPWAELDFAYWLPVVATCWPARLIPDLLAYVDGQRWPESFSSDDEICGRFVREAGERPLATVPSLVEHPDRLPSLIGKRARNGQDPGRVAACFIGADCGSCALEIDWTPGPGGG